MRAGVDLDVGSSRAGELKNTVAAETLMLRVGMAQIAPRQTHRSTRDPRKPD